MSEALEKIKKEKIVLALEIRRQVSGYIVAAFGLVAGLAWNDAIKSLIEFFIPASENTILAKVVYASIVSLVVVLTSYLLVRWSKNQPEKL